MDLTMLYYLVPSLVMFACVVYGFITRMPTSVDINFVVFNRFLFPGQMEGMFFALFAIAIAAAETALAIAIVINIFRAVKNVDIQSLTKMKY